MKQKTWTGTPPEKCQLCGVKITDEFVDGAVKGAGWAYMCRRCHEYNGTGVGVGHGQRYKLENGVFVKVEG